MVGRLPAPYVGPWGSTGVSFPCHARRRRCLRARLDLLCGSGIRSCGARTAARCRRIGGSGGVGGGGEGVGLGDDVRGDGVGGVRDGVGGVGAELAGRALRSGHPHHRHPADHRRCRRAAHRDRRQTLGDPDPLGRAGLGVPDHREPGRPQPDPGRGGALCGVGSARPAAVRPDRARGAGLRHRFCHGARASAQRAARRTVDRAPRGRRARRTGRRGPLGRAGQHPRPRGHADADRDAHLLALDRRRHPGRRPDEPGDGRRPSLAGRPAAGRRPRRGGRRTAATDCDRIS